MKTFTNILVTLTFAFGCLTLWAMLKSLENISAATAFQLPRFTMLFVSERSVLLLLPFVVLACGIFSWWQSRKKGQSNFAFVTCTLSGLFLISFPVLMAVFIPMLVLMERTK